MAWVSACEVTGGTGCKSGGGISCWCSCLLLASLQSFKGVGVGALDKETACLLIRAICEKKGETWEKGG